MLYVGITMMMIKNVIAVRPLNP